VRRGGACAGGLPLSVGADAQRRAWTPEGGGCMWQLWRGASRE
jgi:hypothetical protein